MKLKFNASFSSVRICHSAFIAKTILCILLFNCFVIRTYAQEAYYPEKREKSPIPFRSSRLIYGRSSQTTLANSLDFRVSGRFGRLSQGFDDWFGLDTAFVRIGVDYGITDRLMVGFGRTKLDKEFDFSAAYKILRQSTEDNSMPVTLTAYGGLFITDRKFPGEDIDFGDRLSTMLQLTVSRTFAERIYVQVAPAWVYNAHTPQADDEHHIISVGLGANVRILKRVSVSAEYYPLFSGSKFEGTTSPLVFGIDLETHGHSFQLFFGNSMAPSEHLFLTHTTDKWSKGQIHFGFNLLRIFSFK